MKEFAVTSTAATVATMVAIEAARHLPVLSSVFHLRRVGTRVARVLRSTEISEHWKEQVLPVYALQLLKSSSLLLGGIVGISLAYAFTFYLVCKVANASVQWSAVMFHPGVLILSFVVAVAVLDLYCCHAGSR